VVDPAGAEAPPRGVSPGPVEADVVEGLARHFKADPEFTRGGVAFKGELECAGVGVIDNHQGSLRPGTVWRLDADLAADPELTR
jgi:hypothetical protein